MNFNNQRGSLAKSHMGNVGEQLVSANSAEDPRKTATGRICIKATAYFTEYVNADPDVHPDKDEIVFEFAPASPERPVNQPHYNYDS
jgi:hypothetical protein